MILSKDAWEQICFDIEKSTPRVPPVNVEEIQHLMIYGAGYGGLVFIELLRSCGIEPECLIDRSPQKQGRKIMGVPVYAPDQVRLEDAVVIVCMMDMGSVYQQIKQQLTDMGCKSVFHMYELRENRVLFANQPKLISPDRNIIWENRGLLYQVYKMLEDDASRQVLTAIFRYLWNDLSTPIPILPHEDQYFSQDIYLLSGHETFVDCGAHVGEILERFLQLSRGQFDTYWAFEPDSQNLDALEAACPAEFRKQIVTHNIALGDKADTVQIRNYDGNNSLIRPDGEKCAPCLPLDYFCQQLHPTILKIDVEGWESRLLTGGQKIIQRDKPLIAIAVYHREQDFWEIPLLLKQWVPEYRFYLRSYLNVAETILYAVPPERVIKKKTSL